jgi:hypothetical protein
MLINEPKITLENENKINDFYLGINFIIRVFH